MLGLMGPAIARSEVAFGLALLVFSWVRSGICFPRSALRSVLRELVLCGGGAAVIAIWGPSTPLAWALGIWLFSLLQALFFILFEPGEESRRAVAVDPFDRAAGRIEDLLDGI